MQLVRGVLSLGGNTKMLEFWSMSRSYCPVQLVPASAETVRFLPPQDADYRRHAFTLTCLGCAVSGEVPGAWPSHRKGFAKTSSTKIVEGVGRSYNPRLFTDTPWNGGPVGELTATKFVDTFAERRSRSFCCTPFVAAVDRDSACNTATGVCGRVFPRVGLFSSFRVSQGVCFEPAVAWTWRRMPRWTSVRCSDTEPFPA